MCGRRSMSRILSSRWLASCSAMTLPANPAPTTSQSYTRDYSFGPPGGGAERRKRVASERQFVGERRLDQSDHLRPGSVPRHFRQAPIDWVEPIGHPFGQRQRCRGFLDEIRRAIGDPHRVEMAPAMHDIDDWGRNYRLSGCKVFWRLGRADKTRRFVQRERHHRRVPVRYIRRERRVLLAAEIVDVWRSRQGFGVDFDHRAYQDQLPVWPR